MPSTHVSAPPSPHLTSFVTLPGICGATDRFPAAISRAMGYVTGPGSRYEDFAPFSTNVRLWFETLNEPGPPDVYGSIR